MPIREPLDVEQIAAVLRHSRIELTEAHFYDMIEEALNEPGECRRWPYYALDFVASREDWAAFKRALVSWLIDHEAEARVGFDAMDAELADEAAPPSSTRGARQRVASSAPTPATVRAGVGASALRDDAQAQNAAGVGPGVDL
jgi:hypothetical protein